MAKNPRLGDGPVSLEYLNNHIPQKIVKEVLKSNGVTDEALALIDWNKSNFPGERFTAIFPKPLSEWPMVYTQGRTTDFPKVQEALKLLYEDQGIIAPDLPGFVLTAAAAKANKKAKQKLKQFVLPTHFEDHHNADPIDWPRVEKFLATLSKEDLETFCYGDQDDMIAIADRGEENGHYAYHAVDTLFEMIGG